MVVGYKYGFSTKNLSFVRKNANWKVCATKKWQVRKNV